MFVGMGVGLGTIVGFVMPVLMMLIVTMGMAVDQPFVAVQMFMALSEMQVYPNRHHHRCHPEQATRAL